MIEQQDTVTASIPLAWKAIPRLATAAIVLVLVCAGLIVLNGDANGAATQSLDDVVLGAEIDSDFLIETIVCVENGDG